jgi:NADPH:quinone reductase-like Zn-dependent oxidoreductase
MVANLPSQGLRLTSTLAPDGTLTVELAEVPVPQPGPDEVIVRVEAAPINPSDLISLLASADPAAAKFEGAGARLRVTARLSPEALQIHAGRIGQPQPVGLEGAGTVVGGGRNAEALVGKKVAVLSLGRGLFAQYCKVTAAECLALPEGTTAAEGADVYVNPLTALAMVETMRLENHAGLIHTAAASNLGQMLVKICREDRVPLVNIVRRQEHVDLLRGLGATHVCNSGAATFRDDLVRALAETGATLAFDAIGGGTMAGEILAAIETVARSRLAEYSPYGSLQAKQVYIYGLLDHSPTVLSRSYGTLWGVGGWLMPAILARVGPERSQTLRERVLAGLKTTFASRYAREISLADMLRRDVMIAYSRQATGEKYLINPTL